MPDENVPGAHDPELVVGLVTPVGTNTAGLAERLQVALGKWNYGSLVIKLTDYFDWLSPPHPNEREDERIRRLVKAANDFCRERDARHAMVSLAIVEIGQKRILIHRAGGATDDIPDSELVTRPVPRQAYIIHSLKRPDEIGLLRATYGPQFILLASQPTPEERVENLVKRNLSAPDEGSRIACAESLMRLDANEEEDAFGQRVNASFPLADYFVPAESPLDRFADLIFGAPHAPTTAELAMYLAHATSLSSLSTSRQVGATLVLEDSVVAVGCNEVPKGEDPDVKTGIDASEALKREMLTDTLEHLGRSGLLSVDAVTPEVVSEAASGLKGSQLLSIIEYQRPVHAEQAAIADAARRGQVVEDAVLFCTTYPCHLCFKAALAVGIKEIRYIHPYPKSRATSMFPNNVSRLQPYEGVAPRMYLRAFEERKLSEADEEAHYPEPDRHIAQPIVPNARTMQQIRAREKEAAQTIRPATAENIEDPSA
jgi:deoxycytidylate deaminase